jgi:hypothetical protein
MKKLTCIIALVLMSILMGCSATMTPEERKELYSERKGSYDLRETVGYHPFVGGNSLDSRGLAISVY